MNKASDTTLLNFLERLDGRVHRLPDKSGWIAGSEGTIAVGSTVREAIRNLRDAFNIDKKENINE